MLRSILAVCVRAQKQAPGSQQCCYSDAGCRSCRCKETDVPLHPVEVLLKAVEEPGVALLLTPVGEHMS